MIKSTIVSSCIVTENFVQCDLRAVVMKKRMAKGDRMLVPDFAGRGSIFMLSEGGNSRKIGDKVYFIAFPSKTEKKGIFSFLWFPYCLKGLEKMLQAGRHAGRKTLSHVISGKVPRFPSNRGSFFSEKPAKWGLKKVVSFN